MQQAETRDRKQASRVRAHRRIIKGLNQDGEIRIGKQRVLMVPVPVGGGRGVLRDMNSHPSKRRKSQR